MFRSLLALLAGYFVMSVLVVLTFVVLGALVPDAFHEEEARVDQPWMTVIVALGFVWAVAGGWVCARVAPGSPFGHALVLGAIVLGLWALTSSRAPTEQSTAYQLFLNFSGVGGILIGGGLGAWSTRGRAER